LSKNSNTDMDFVWINNDQGDITGVTATSPLTGGGTSGAITVGIQSASTSQAGAVQLTDSTSSTSTSTAATPNAVKSAYDLANNAIPKSTVTTSGDVIYATGSSAVTRLGIGTTGQVLTVSSGVPTWATPATSSAGMVYVGGSSFSGSSAVNLNNIFTSTYANYKIIFNCTGSANGLLQIRFRVSGSDNSTTNYEWQRLSVYGTTSAPESKIKLTTCLAQLAQPRVVLKFLSPIRKQQQKNYFWDMEFKNLVKVQLRCF